jgi:hypothetical protein
MMIIADYFSICISAIAYRNFKVAANLSQNDILRIDYFTFLYTPAICDE